MSYKVLATHGVGVHPSLLEYSQVIQIWQSPRAGTKIEGLYPFIQKDQIQILRLGGNLSLLQFFSSSQIPELSNSHFS